MSWGEVACWWLTAIFVAVCVVAILHLVIDR